MQHRKGEKKGNGMFYRGPLDALEGGRIVCVLCCAVLVLLVSLCCWVLVSERWGRGCMSAEVEYRLLTVWA